MQQHKQIIYDLLETTEYTTKYINTQKPFISTDGEQIWSVRRPWCPLHNDQLRPLTLKKAQNRRHKLHVV